MKKYLITSLMAAFLSAQCFAENFIGPKFAPYVNDEIYYRYMDYAIETNDMEALQTLLRGGASANTTGTDPQYGATPILFKALLMQESLQAAQILIDAGADVNSRDKNGDTLLSWALLQENPVLTKFLLQAGGSTRNVDRYGNSTLFFAFFKSNIGLHQLDLLIQEGAPFSSDLLEEKKAIRLSILWPMLDQFSKKQKRIMHYTAVRYALLEQRVASSLEINPFAIDFTIEGIQMKAAMATSSLSIDSLIDTFNEFVDLEWDDTALQSSIKTHFKALEEGIRLAQAGDSKGLEKHTTSGKPASHILQSYSGAHNGYRNRPRCRTGRLDQYGTTHRRS
jgi:ankyrin repeat protein